MADRIAAIIRENDMMGEIVEETADMVGVEIAWGDWKHEHLRLAHLVKEAFPELKNHTEVVTEDDGSDCYSALHRFYF